MGDRHTKKIFLVVEKIVVLSYYANLQIQNKDKIKNSLFKIEWGVSIFF